MIDHLGSFYPTVHDKGPVEVLRSNFQGFLPTPPDDLPIFKAEVN